MVKCRLLLPLQGSDNRISLGEGWTPILSIATLANRLGMDQLLLKDESFNPTGSFKARGLSMAVSKGKDLVLKLASFLRPEMRAGR